MEANSDLSRKNGERSSLRMRMSQASRVLQEIARRPSLTFRRKSHAAGVQPDEPSTSKVDSLKGFFNTSVFRRKSTGKEKSSDTKVAANREDTTEHLTQNPFQRSRKRGIAQKENLPMRALVIPKIEITDVSDSMDISIAEAVPEFSALNIKTNLVETLLGQEVVQIANSDLSETIILHEKNKCVAVVKHNLDDVHSHGEISSECVPTLQKHNGPFKVKISVFENEFPEVPHAGHKRNTLPVLSTESSSIGLQTMYRSASTCDEQHGKKNLQVRYGKTLCQLCKKKCSGEVLRVQDKYFHISCFKCKVCASSLAQGGFFSKENEYYCTKDYQDKFGTKCANCHDFVEGDVVTALGNTYHQKCFTCARCRQPFPTGERVTFTGHECLCQKCSLIPIVESHSPQQPSSPTLTGPQCAGCREELKEGQALIALDKQWHIWCFKCNSCGVLLHGEYMGKDGHPYCEKDYQLRFGVKCAYCDRYISGKVLQAGDNHHFHPTCARCSKCGDPFGDGEEMYLQGAAIWHPRCGPGPTEGGTILNGGVVNGTHLNESTTEGRESRISSSAASEIQFSRSRTPSINGSAFSPYSSFTRKYSGPRSYSPGLLLRDYNKMAPDDISRIYTYSYLAAEPTQGYLKRPIDPYDRPPKSPHFHRPPSSGQKSSRSPSYPGCRTSKPAMKVLIDSLEREQPRPKSPYMNNEEPIELSHYPSGHKPNPQEQPKIERDDFPAPPYPYTDPERRRRWSGSVKGVSVAGSDGENDYEEEVDSDTLSSHADDPKLKKGEQELSKIATGIGKVFLQNLKEREKFRAWKANHMDPRNASRAPSANHEVPLRLRYDSPINASPSRLLDRPRPFDEDVDGSVSGGYRSSLGRSAGTIPGYNVISAVRSPPRPGYTLKASTLPASLRNGNVSSLGDYSSSGMGDKTQSIEFSSNKSDISATSLSEADRRALGADIRSSTTYSSGLTRRTVTPGQFASPHPSLRPGTNLRRSLPNMSHAAYLQHLAHVSNEPPKIYPVHLLFTSNYRLPVDVDRCHLERHLSDADFDTIFQMSRDDFYRMPEWRRNEVKRRVRLY